MPHCTYLTGLQADHLHRGILGKLNVANETFFIAHSLNSLVLLVI